MAWKISIADDNHAICQRCRLVQRKASLVAENSLQNIFKVCFPNSCWYIGLNCFSQQLLVHLLVQLLSQQLLVHSPQLLVISGAALSQRCHSIRGRDSFVGRREFTVKEAEGLSLLPQEFHNFKYNRNTFGILDK